MRRWISCCAVVAVVAATGTNGQLISLGNGEWQWSWKTGKTWIGCRELILVSTGETAFASFRFR